MKKIKSLIALLALTLALTGCASTSALSEFDEAATPENSVLVFGTFVAVDEAYFNQADFNYAPDIQKVIFPSKKYYIFYLKPVAPNSYYTMEYAGGTRRIGNTIYYYNDYYPLQGSVWDFKVPSKPGLYFYGSYDYFASLSSGEKKEFKKFFYYTDADEELNCLKLLLPYFKKTAWEQTIKDRMEELKASK